MVLARTSNDGAPSYLSVSSQLSVTICDGLGVYGLLDFVGGANTLKAVVGSGATVAAIDNNDMVLIAL